MTITQEEAESLAFQSQRESFADFTRWRFNPDDILIMLEHDLKGEYFKEDTREWIKAGKRLMNDEGVAIIVSLARTSVNKVTFLSDLTINEIMLICRDLNISLVETLFFKWEEIEVEKDHLDLVVSKIVNFIFIALKQALNAGTRESLGKMEKIVRSYDNVEQKKSGFSAFSPFGSGNEER